MGLSPPTLVKLLNKSDFGFDKNPDGSPRGNALGMSFWRNQRYPMVQRLPDDFDPETFEGITRIDNIGGEKVIDEDPYSDNYWKPIPGKFIGGTNVTRYLTPRDVKSINFLSPLKQGRGWRQTTPFLNDESGYNIWEGQTLPELFSTMSHEDTHDATQAEIKAAARHSGKFMPRRKILGRYEGTFPYRGSRGRQRDAESARMMSLLDDERAQRRYLQGPREGDGSPRFVMPQTDRSAYDEMAAYTGEFPQNPGYATGRWLMHHHVEQANRRKALQEIAAAQKKWGMDPIDAKAMVEHLNPKNRYRLTDETKRIMGPIPERRPPFGQDDGWQPTQEVSAQRLLFPPEERIYRNLRNAILGQTGSMMANSGMFASDPAGYMNRDARYAERLKGAKSLGAEALSALDSYFKQVNAGEEAAPRSISDLPESLRGELGRLELRRILANQVADQHRLVDDEDWKNPDNSLRTEWRPKMLWDNPKSADLEGMSDWNYRDDGISHYQSNPYIPRLSDYAEHFSEDEREKYGQIFDKYKELKEIWNKKHNNDWSLNYQYRRNPDGEGSSDQYGRLIEEAMQKDYDEHNIWAKRPDLFDKHPPGPYLQAVLEQIEQEKTGMQGQIDELAASLGITDHRAMNRPQVYPEQMLDDMEFVEFDPDNPEHKKALDWWDKEAKGGHGYHHNNMPSRGKRFAGTTFPSLHYGLIPKQALEWHEDDGTSRDRARYNSPETTRTYQSGYYGKDKTITQDNLQGLLQDPFESRRGRYSHEDDIFPEQNMIPHPLAGKPIMERVNVGPENLKDWELLSEGKKAFKANRLKYGGTHPFFGPKSGVRRHNNIDIPTFLNDIAEKEGISYEQARQKYIMGGWDSEWNSLDDTSAESGLWFRRRGNKGERERPKKLEQREKWEYDPVTRAIAQAFMDMDMKRIVDEDSSSEDQMVWDDADIGSGSFGSKPHGSEYQKIKGTGYRAPEHDYDETQRNWDLESYMRQLKHPHLSGVRSDHTRQSGERTRKSLNDILREITTRRQQEQDDKVELE
jgi:hypothetical protein